MGRRIGAMLLVAGCGSGRTDAPFRVGFAADATNGPSGGALTLDTGEVRAIELLVVGSTRGNVVFSADHLPGFATLSGALLTLAPHRADAGQYTILLRASDGENQASQSLGLVVKRSNQAPVLSDPYPMFFVDDLGNRAWTCPSQWCTLFGSASILFNGYDPDGDDVVAEAEVLPISQSFTGNANVVARLSATQFIRFDYNGPRIPLPQLQQGVSYHFAVRITDAFGATNHDSNRFTQLGDGWETGPRFVFDAGPCTDRTCACVPNNLGYQGNCIFDQDCCSGGRCVGSPGSCVSR